MPLWTNFVVCLFLIVFIPIIWRRWERFACVLVIVCFAASGMVRISSTSQPVSEAAIPVDGPALFHGVVTESSANLKVLCLTSPENMEGTKAIFRTEENLGIDDGVKIFGTLEELTPTFKNPYLLSWKWLKGLEGISCEVKGKIIAVSGGNNHIEAWRRFLADRIDASGARWRGIIKALAIGDTTGLDEDTKNLFLRTGTSHILAISGSNIAIVTTFFFFFARMLLRISRRMRLRGDDKKYAALASVPFVFLFMVTAGSGIPVIRAAIMITVYMTALFFERTKHMWNTIALAALIILVIYPHSVFTPTFQLTFISVIFIVAATKVFYPIIQTWQPLLKWFFSSVMITMAATAGTLPIVLYHFWGFNPFCVIHNLAAVPLMCVIATPLALLGTLVPYGEWVLRLAGETVQLTIRILRFIDFGYIYPTIRPVFLEIIFYLIVCMSLKYYKERLFRFLLLWVILPVVLAYSSWAIHERFFNKTACINFIDVGLGEAILIEAPSGTRILIDGGGFYGSDFDTGKSVIAPILLSKKIRTLDYVINTHRHGDHAKGLVFIVNNFHVGHFVTGPFASFGVSSREPLKMAVKGREVPIETWKAGDRFRLNDKTVIEVLNPPRQFSLENPNLRSLVLKVTFFGKDTFLLTGDIDSTVEDNLIKSPIPLRAGVLKVPHHGSKYAGSLAFLRAVEPSVAVMSTGKGIRGIPSEEAILRYKALSIPLLRTDRDGFVTICTNGRKMTCSSYIDK